MSARLKRTAQVFETTPARLLSLVERQPDGATSTSPVSADVADGLEAINQIANLAGYGEGVRNFVFAVATLAHNRGGKSVELYDEEFAELWDDCSTKTVQRHRKAYLSESRRLRTVDLVGIVEGEFERDKSRHAPTRYTFHLAGTVERIVADARSDPRWHDLERKAQREMLKQAAARAYDLIPDAVRRPRKRKRPRLASAVVETHPKAAETHLRKLHETARLLSEADRERLFNDPGELRERLRQLPALVGQLCNVDSPDSVTLKDLGGGGGQIVHHPHADDRGAPEPAAESAAAWDRLSAGLSQSSAAVRTVEIHLRPPEYPPGELNYGLDEDESREAEALRMEACGDLARSSRR